MDDGSEDRREMQVGDYRIYVDIYEDSDGYRTQNLVTETIVGTEGGTYLIRSDDGFSSTTFYADYEYLHPEFPDEYLVTEEIAVEIPFVGERVCTTYSFEEADGLTIIYVDPDTGDVLYETGMSTSVSTEIIAERVLISDSISMQEPEFGSSTYNTDLTVGDYITFYASTDVVDGTDVTGGRTNLGYVEAGSWIDYNIYINDSPFDSISYDVVSVDGDDAMVSVDSDEPVQMTVYQLLNGYPEGAGLRLIGQSVLETMWGSIVCDVYLLEAQYETYYYIGASDGVNYMTEYIAGEDLYTVYLEGSSTVI